MKVYNLILDLLENTKLFELAFDRKVVINKIQSQYFNINTHLMYLLMYPDSTSKNHWKVEISGWLKGISDLNIKGGKLDKDFYFDKLYKQPFNPNPINELKHLFNSAEENENLKSEVILDFNNVNKLFYDFYSNISALFSNKYILKKDISILIDKHFIN